MKISTRSLYGLRMLFHLALHFDQGPLQLSEIASRESISEKYLGQIVLLLRASGILSSVRGAQGGYLLTRSPKTITVLEIIECLEVELVRKQEAEVSCDDTESQCAANEIWDKLQFAVTSTLGAITLDDMTKIPQTKRQIFDYSI